MINSNPLLLNDFDYSDAELICGNLSEENKTILTNKFNIIISSINDQKINSIFKNATLPQKSAFIEAYNNGLVSNQKIELLTKFMQKNKFVLSTFNYSLFDDRIYNLFDDKILFKLSKYYDVVKQIDSLKLEPRKMDLFARLVATDNNSSSSIVEDQKMSMTLTYLLKNNVEEVLLSANNKKELDVARNIILKQIDQFSILDGATLNEIVRERSLINPENYTLENYDLKLAEKCDQLLMNATTKEEVQNLIFNKYFSMCIEDAQELFRIYGTRFESIKSINLYLPPIGKEAVALFFVNSPIATSFVFEKIIPVVFILCPFQLSDFFR
jgi:hypothetical protein